MSTEIEQLQEFVALTSKNLNECALKVQTLKTQFGIIKDSVNKLTRPNAQGVATPTTPAASITTQQTTDEEFKKRVKNVVSNKLGGLNQDVWLTQPKAASSNEPEFVPIEKRNSKTRFVSFINFKGGVGKTTLTSNLTAAFASGNYRTSPKGLGKELKVLVVDLDFQGTLTDRCVPADSLEDFFQSTKTSVYLLESCKNAELKLKDIIYPFVHNENAEVIPSNARLDYADNQILNYQLFDICESRFNYRTWFHTQDVFDAYDLVVFDCPPRKTASSICALAASDYVFIPTAPDKFDFNSVSRTIEWLVTFSYKLNLPLKIGGVVFNRTSAETKLSDREQNFKNLLAGMITDMFIRAPKAPSIRYLRLHGNCPTLLNTFIPRRAGKDSINGEPGEALPGGSVKNKFFTNLATEIYERIYQ